MTYSKQTSVTIIGAGNSGQAVAAFLSLSGYKVRLWNRDESAELDNWINPIRDHGGLDVTGLYEDFAPIVEATSDLGDALAGSHIVIVNTTTDSFYEIGTLLAPHVTSSHRVLLMAAGSLGSIDFWSGILAGGYSGDLLVGETSTTVFGSRSIGPAKVRIGGRKEGVEVATLPSGLGGEFAELMPEFNFTATGDVLKSGFNNVGSVLHAVPMVLTAGWVEAHGGEFLYYVEGITPSIARVMEDFDCERLAVAKAFGYEATSLATYLTDTVGAPAGDLYTSIHNCEMYKTTKSATQLDHRFLWEDTMAGVVPILSLAKVANVPTPLHEAIASLAGALLGRDLMDEGRTIEDYGLENISVKEMYDIVTDQSAFNEWKSLSMKQATVV